MERRLAQLVRVGKVSAIDYSDRRKPRVRVKSGKIETGWIPFSALRAGRKRSWHPMKVGEQVVMVCPSGDLAQAIIVGSIHYNDRQSPANGEMQWVDEHDDGAKVSYDEETHSFIHEIPEGGTITLKIGGVTLTMTDSSVEIKAPSVVLDAANTRIKGDVDVDGEIIAQGDVIGKHVSLAHHRNSGVMAGPANTDEPIPEA